MTLWPHEIADDEAIVRGICSPYHVKNGKLRPNAYRPPNDSDEVSVMRVAWIGASACKQHAKDLEDPVVQPPKIYKGLAVLSAGQIRHHGAEMADTRHVFNGHADIRHGITPSRSDPPPPQQLVILVERTKALAELANYYSDPDTALAGWNGAPLHYNAPKSVRG